VFDTASRIAGARRLEMSTRVLEACHVLQTAKSWEDLNRMYEEGLQPDPRSKARWVFRGQRDADWGLRTSLERELENFGIDLAEKASDVECGLLRAFKRRCYHYIPDPPDEDQTLEWLALMQHYGTPTRLLDWTYSFFVALYFAVANINLGEDSPSTCAVWAFDTGSMHSYFRSALEPYSPALSRWENDEALLRPETFRSVFCAKQPIPLVGAVTPHRINKRLTIQQGVFLCPGDVRRSFAQNLRALLSYREPKSETNFIKIEITVCREQRNRILRRLLNMNMNEAVLFPGLEGFARSLRVGMVWPDAYLHPGDEGC
jgi:hypothetical protein